MYPGLSVGVALLGVDVGIGFALALVVVVFGVGVTVAVLVGVLGILVALGVVCTNPELKFGSNDDGDAVAVAQPVSNRPDNTTHDNKRFKIFHLVSRYTCKYIHMLINELSREN